MNNIDLVKQPPEHYVPTVNLAYAVAQGQAPMIIQMWIDTEPDDEVSGGPVWCQLPAIAFEVKPSILVPNHVQ